MPFQHVLLPLDGSPAAEEAIAHAIAVARSCGADIHLLHVQKPPSHTDEHSIDPVDWRLRRAELNCYLKRLGERVSAAGVALQVAVREGRPAEQIVEYCDESGIDLIVFTSYGKGGESRFHFGSTAQKVFSGAERSFMIVRPGAMPAVGERDGYRRILVSVDGSPRGEWVACQVAAMMRGQKVEMILLETIAVPEMPRRMPITREEHATLEKFIDNNRRAAQVYLEEMARQLQNGIKVSVRLDVAPDQADCICATAANENVDLIAISAHDWQSGRQRVTGNLCQSVMCSSPVPVLVLQERTEASAGREAGEFSGVSQEMYSQPNVGHQ